VQSFLVAQLACNVTNSARALLFKRFGGLITPFSESHPTKTLPAWEAKLWSTTASRNRILVAWGHRAKVVLTDGVEYNSFIGLNAR